MDTYDKNLNACLLHRNKQLTRQLKDYQQTLALTDCSSSLMLAMGQLLRLHRLPSYGLVTSEEEWCHSRSVLKAKQRIKIKLALSATDSLDIYIQNLSRWFPARACLPACPVRGGCKPTACRAHWSSWPRTSP